jgi:hypothetical protein
MNLISLVVLNIIGKNVEILLNTDSVVSLEKESDYYVLYLVDGRKFKLTEEQYQEQFVKIN